MLKIKKRDQNSKPPLNLAPTHSLAEAVREIDFPHPLGPETREAVMLIKEAGERQRARTPEEFGNG